MKDMMTESYQRLPAKRNRNYKKITKWNSKCENIIINIKNVKNENSLEGINILEDRLIEIM